jgi:hypothetical protein
MSSYRVAIIVPLSRHPSFGESETLSLRHLDHFLGRYPKYFLAPKGIRLVRDGFEMKHFPSRYFGSVQAHNRLLLSERFYQSFSDYEFILIHHLDALVFSDALEDWCDRGFDLIAPPWIPGPDFPWLEEPGVGNGGLSLRRVDAFLKILHSKRHWRVRQTGNDRGGSGRAGFAGVARYVKDLRLHWYRFNGVKQEARNFVKRGGNEDRFWWKRGRHYYPEFRIAPVDTALDFAFEAYPRKCLEMTNGRFPFGCHAWERYDKSFWEPHLLPRENVGADAACGS